MILTEAFQKFVHALDGEVQSTTIRWYTSHLSTLITTFGEREVGEITVDDLRNWRYEQFHHATRYDSHPSHPQMQGELSVYTKRGRVRALKRFFRWLRDEDYIASDPTRRMKSPPKPGNREPKAIAEADIVKLFAVARNHPRNLALLYILEESGARVAGVVGLRLRDVSVDCCTLIVTEKGGKSRPVYLTAEGARALCAWLAERPAVSNDAVFLSEKRGTPLTNGGVSQILKRMARVAGVERFNPHSFRHAFAREMLSAGASLDVVSDMLGHSGVSVTAESYAVWTKAELKVKHGEFLEIRRAKRD